jgi:hypothetical protein
MSIYLAGNPAAAEGSRQWRKRTGLKLSKASLTGVFGLAMDVLPKGLDHTQVYCIGRSRVILTEPYGNGDDLLKELHKFARRFAWKNIEYCMGDKDRSIWSPGNCTPILIGVGDHGFDLFNLVNMLPMTRHALLRELLPGLKALFGMDYEALKK